MTSPRPKPDKGKIKHQPAHVSTPEKVWNKSGQRRGKSNSGDSLNGA